MNEINNSQITLENRKKLHLTGVSKIESLNPLEFQLQTLLGNLCIKGSELEMQLFDVDKGNMSITGNIDSLIYYNKSVNKKNKGFIQKLFK